jgi:ATPase family associated with various cellular activities (AAA)/Winged helix domain, variant
MIDAAEWQKNNEAYLAAAFDWLRLRLMSLAPPPSAIIVHENLSPVGKTEEEDERHWSVFRRKKTSAKTPVAEISAPSMGDLLDAQIAEAAAALDAAAKTEPPPAAVILRERLGLSRFEEQIILFCAAFELDTKIAALCARAHDDAHKPYPTFALAMAMLDEPAWDALSPQRPLRYLHLVEINQPPSQPLTASALRADERILNFVKGLNEFDDRLMPIIAAVDAPDIDLPPSQQAVADEILRDIGYSTQSAPEMRPPLIELTGIDGVSKQLVASKVAAEFQMNLYRLPAEALPANAAELETLARLWQRETLLKPVALYLDASDSGNESSAGDSLRRFSAGCAGLTFLDTRAAWNVTGNKVSVFDVSRPTTAEQKEAWASQLDAALNDIDEEENTVKSFEANREKIESLPTLLANQFNLSLPVIHRIADGALAREPDSSSLGEVVWEMCLASSRPHLDTLAQRIEPKAKSGDLVLPEQELELLNRIAEQVRNRGTVYDTWGFRERMNRGLGISALFAGESGTGKTMAAEVIANQLRLNLYRIDLSAVVSKFIGETEKNLRRLFDAAEDGGAILFFDEADALFGKRSEVKDSHDRYANIEINYLLQRLESYKGLSILATNMKSSLDAAFMRRFRFIVDFPFPGTPERRQIWEKVFPPKTPNKGLNFERLAQFNLSGGSINNIALNAAFLAAKLEPPVITMEVIFDAMQTELRKIGRPVNQRDFALPAK